jgi:hypothetical protein
MNTQVAEERAETRDEVNTTRKPYGTPQLVRYGDVASLTQQGRGGRGGGGGRRGRGHGS